MAGLMAVINLTGKNMLILMMQGNRNVAKIKIGLNQPREKKNWNGNILKMGKLRNSLLSL